MNAGLLLLLYLATICWSAALPVEHGGDVLKRDSEDYTETVTIKLPSPTSKTSSNQGRNVTVTVTETKSTSTVKKTTSTKKGTTTGLGSPTKTVYKTITEIVTTSTIICSAPPSYTIVTTSFCDDTIKVCIDDGSSTTTDGGSDWISFDLGSLTLGVNKEKRQIWLEPFSTTDYATPHPTFGILVWSPVTSTTTETEEVVTTTNSTERPHHHHTTTKPAPSITSSNNLNTTLYLEFPTFDKRQ
jgi:hypothetical protein